MIYNKVIELGILKCDFSTFIGGVPTDIDFKKDYEMELDNYKEIIKACSLMSKNSSQVDVGKRLHKGENNLGISWSKRETSKYIANPFTKIYHKGLEFISPKDKGGSKEFKDKYLSHIDTSNIIRIETTVKNKRHLESLKLDLKYLEQDIFCFEPINSLNGGIDGLSEIRKVITKSSELIKKKGKLILEIAFDQKIKVIKLLKNKGFYINKTLKDYANNDRCIISTKI